MPTDSHGASISFAGLTLGSLVSVRPSFSVVNVHDATSLKSTVIGNGSSARVVKQYNATSVDPGTITARFLGSPSLSMNDCGRSGKLTFSWPDGKAISGAAFMTSLDSEFNVGELIQWSATFQFSGF